MKKLSRFFVYTLLFLISSSTSVSALFNGNTPISTNANTIIKESTILFEVKSASHASEKRYLRATILNEYSPYNQVRIFYDTFKKVTSLKAKIVGVDGKEVKKFTMKDVQDYSAVSNYSIYDDSRVKYLELPHHSYPYTIVYEYEVEHTGLQGYPSWHLQKFNTIVQSANYLLKLPKDYSVQYKVLNGDIVPIERVEKGHKLLEWRVNNLPAVMEEAYGPTIYQLLPILLFAPNKFEIEGRVGSLSSWSDFGSFIFQLWEGKDVLSNTMRTKVIELTKNALTEREKIDILYQYLQNNMRYVSVQLGIGGWQPFDAKYVERNKYGDCKALTNFMKSMLQVIGIESFPALIKTGGESLDIDPSFAYPHFNHVILHIPSQDMWLECTSSSAPLGFIGLTNANKKILLIKPEGGILAQTPQISPLDNFLKTTAKITLSTRSSATIEVSQWAKSAQHTWMRVASDNWSTKKIEEQILEQTELASPIFKAIDFKVSETNPEASINYTAESKRYCSKAGKRLFVPINAINRFELIAPENKNRIHPVLFKNGFYDEGSYEFVIPEGYKVENCPTKNTLIETPFGTYSLACSVEGNKLTIKRSLLVPSFKEPAAKYEAFCNFFKAVAKADNGKFVLAPL